METALPPKSFPIKSSLLTSEKHLHYSSIDSSQKMQNDGYSTDVHGGFGIGDGALSLNSPYGPNDGGFNSFYSSNPFPSSHSFSSYTDSDDGTASTEIPNSLYHYRLNGQHQELVNRHHLCLNQLRKAVKEAESLSLENSKLRSVNQELIEQLRGMIQASEPNRLVLDRTNMAPFDAANAFRCLCIGNEGRDGADGGKWDKVGDASPTSVMENGMIKGTDVQRTTLPKSISVRSNGYLKLSPAGAGASHHGGCTRPWTASPFGGKQKVYVRGGKKEEEPLELEVYNQGMTKTELCNKWQQTGTCPYGDNCQFAHGVEELRPVIRHPRYKTQVCKMVLAGDVCPYGHRCHFRHALTEEEKFMASLNLRKIKLDS